jgi:hypothetical protein
MQKVIREAYTLYTPESVEAGDAAEHGWIDEDGVDMMPDEYDVEEDITAADKAVEHLWSEGATEASSSSFNPGVWYSVMRDPDMRTGEQEERSFHLDGFSLAEERAIFGRLRQAGRGPDETGHMRFNPRAHRHNPPLSEHMAEDDLDEVAQLLAHRFVTAVAQGRASGFSEFSSFVRTLSRQVFKNVESFADARISDNRQAALLDLGEIAMRVSRHTTLPPRR